MYLGFSNAKINPNCEVELSGYGYYLERKAISVLDDIYARAMYIKGDDTTFLVICCDLLALSNYIVNKTKEILSAQLKIGKEHILLLCTHTHTAPSSAQTIGCGEVNWDYIEFVIDRIVEAGANASANLHKITKIRSCNKEISNVGYNRTDKNGIVDNNVYGVVFDLENNSPFVVANYGCHAVTLGIGNKVSPDYPFEVIHSLEQKGYHGIFFNGFCGDIDPISNSEGRVNGTKEMLVEYGRKISDGLLEGLEESSTEHDLSISDAAFNVKIELKNYTWNELDETIKREFHDLPFPNMDQAISEWQDVLKRRIINDYQPFLEEVEVQVLKLGDILVIGMQGELYTQIGLDIRKALNDNFIILCSNANTAIRYIPTYEDIQRKSYGGFSSNIVYATFPTKDDAGQKYANDTVASIRRLLL